MVKPKTVRTNFGVPYGSFVEILWLCNFVFILQSKRCSYIQLFFRRPRYQNTHVRFPRLADKRNMEPIILTAICQRVFMFSVYPIHGMETLLENNYGNFLYSRIACRLMQDYHLQAAEWKHMRLTGFGVFVHFVQKDLLNVLRHALWNLFYCMRSVHAMFAWFRYLPLLNKFY